MRAPSPPPLAHAAHNGESTTHSRIAPCRTAASPQTPPAGPAWWRCYQGKHGAWVYFTALTTKDTKAHEEDPIHAISCSFVSFVVKLFYLCPMGTYLFGYAGTRDSVNR